MPAENLRRVVELTNAERHRHGLRHLTWSGRLHRSAQWHANDMARTGYFEHNDPSGRVWWKRIMRWFRDPGGENQARGFGDPAAVVEAFMNSPEHRRNILNAEFRKIGVGYSSDGEYWVQDFGY